MTAQRTPTPPARGPAPLLSPRVRAVWSLLGGSVGVGGLVWEAVGTNGARGVLVMVYLALILVPSGVGADVVLRRWLNLPGLPTLEQPDPGPTSSDAPPSDGPAT